MFWALTRVPITQPRFHQIGPTLTLFTLGAATPLKSLAPLGKYFHSKDFRIILIVYFFFSVIDRIVLELVDTSCGTPAFKEKCLTADAVPDEILDNADPNNVTVTVPNSGIPFKWRGCQYNRQNTSQDFLTDAIGAGSSVPTSTGGSVPVGLPTLKNFPASVSMSSSSRSVRSTGIGSFSPAVSTSGSPSSTTTSGSPLSTTSDSPSITSDSPKKSTSGSDSSSSTSDSDFSSSTGDSDSPSSTSGSPSSTTSSGSPSISGSPSSTSSSGSPSTTSYSLSTITIDPPSTTAVSTGSSVSPTGIRARNLIMKNVY